MLGYIHWAKNTPDALRQNVSYFKKITLKMVKNCTQRTWIIKQKYISLVSLAVEICLKAREQVLLISRNEQKLIIDIIRAQDYKTVERYQIKTALPKALKSLNQSSKLVQLMTVTVANDRQITATKNTLKKRY